MAAQQTLAGHQHGLLSHVMVGGELASSWAACAALEQRTEDDSSSHHVYDSRRRPIILGIERFMAAHASKQVTPNLPASSHNCLLWPALQAG